MNGEHTKDTWKEQMRVRLDFNNMMKEFVGENGVSLEEISHLDEKISEAVRSINEKRKAGKLAFMDLPYQDVTLINEIKEEAIRIKDRFDNFVVLGIGGSALGNIAIQQALNHQYYNLLTKEERNGLPKLFVFDNIDPESLEGLLDIIDLDKTVFNVITKSGGTSETMSCFMIIRQKLIDKLGEEKSREHIIATTDREKGNLIKIAEDYGYKTLYIPDDVGGRFSVFTTVGLLSAAVCGLNIEQMLAGAAYMDEACSKTDLFQNPAYMNAVLHYIAMEKGKNISVMMPYADSLKYISDWYAQLWAESLGKKYDLKGNIVNVGQTPVKALGATDQHSQIQLYTEGPDDKVVTFIGVDNYRETVTIPVMFEDIAGVSYLGGHTLNGLIKAEQMATELAVLKSGKMSCTITLPEVNAFTIGQLIYMFEVQTAFAGELLNIDAFDQPGVEEGKNATYALMGRPGYEEKKKELDQRPNKKEGFII